MKLMILMCSLLLTAVMPSKLAAESIAASGESLPLIEAVRDADLQRLRSLLEDGADPNTVDGLSRTALHYAAALGTSDSVSALIGKRAKIDAQDEDGFTPLMRAAQNGHLEAAKLLMDAGAARDLVNAIGETATALAQQNKHTRLLELLSVSK